MHFCRDSESAVHGNTRSHKTSRKLYLFSCSMDNQKGGCLSPVVVSSELEKSPEATWTETISVPLSLRNPYLACSWLSLDSSCKHKKRSMNFNKGWLVACFLPHSALSLFYMSSLLLAWNSWFLASCSNVVAVLDGLAWSVWSCGFSSILPQADKLGSC